MSLCPTQKLLLDARRQRRAVGAFNVGNMEMLMGVLQAAEASATPIILQIAEKRLPSSPLHLIAPMMLEAARQAKVAVGVQLDHGFSRDIISQTMQYGFTSVMFDGSSLPLEENISETKAIVRMAAEADVVVEAEIGVVGGSEGGPEHEICYSSPSEAVRLVNESGCASLAIAIGNAHGHYKGKPKLNFAILEEIASLVSVPLVLHGGSGISPEDFRYAIDLGIAKINIATASFDALFHSAKACFDRPDVNYFDLSSAMVEGVYANAMEHIAIFNNEGAVATKIASSAV